jgi:hypothetical protein
MVHPGSKAKFNQRMGNLSLWYPQQILLVMCLDKQFNQQLKNLQGNHLLYWFVKVNGMIND